MPKTNCKICNQLFYIKPSHQKLGWGIYCSVRCRTIAQRKGKNVACNTCKKWVYRTPARILRSKSGKLFCSKTCQTHWRNRLYIADKHPNWSSGIGSYRKILDRTDAEKKCLACNAVDERILVVHHIDQNRKNNDATNLIWLCHNCHHLVHYDSGFETVFRKSISK